jgi:hypothetical protein
MTESGWKPQENLDPGLANSKTRGRSINTMSGEGKASIGEGASPIRRLIGRIDSTFGVLAENVRGSELTAETPGAFIIWIKAFIPANIPGITRPVPGWSGATMLDVPTIPGCYLTDNRDFSPDWEASARMTSVAAIFPYQMVLDQLHYCDYTVRFDCSSGTQTCVQQADASRMQFINFRGIAGFNSEVDVASAAANPCTFGAGWIGDIDFRGLIAIDTPSRQVLFQGYVDPFPAYEMYAAAITNGVPDPLIGVPLFTKPPNPGATPLDLIGPPNQFVWGVAAV